MPWKNSSKIPIYPLLRYFSSFGIRRSKPRRISSSIRKRSTSRNTFTKTLSKHLRYSDFSLSPLLGLLGTVLGLIASFASLNLGNVGGTQTTNVTGGISEALVSTAAGLIVAIFTLLFANTFRGLYGDKSH